MRGRREGLSWIILVILLLACLPMQGGVGIVKASPGPTLLVDPQIISKAPPDSFDINIKVTDILIAPLCKGLYEWSFLLEFNASILEATNIAMPAPYFLAQTGWKTAWQSGFVAPVIDNFNGFVSAGDAIMPDPWTGELPAYGAIGSGLLATITFRVKAVGTSLLDLKDTSLGTLIGGSPSPIPHEVVDGFFEYPLKVHDIAVTHVTASPLRVPAGDRISINATVKNEGEVAETFDVTVLYGSTAIETKTVTDLAPGGSQTLSFSWNTKDVDPGNYAINAKVPPVPGEKEKDKTDNTKQLDGKVTILGFPVADFTYSPSIPIAGKAVNFDASASHDPDGTIVSYEWNFGDGTPIVTETNPTTTHMYTAPGLYTVNLTVTDNDGLSGTYKKPVTLFFHDVAVTSVTVSHIAVMPGVQVTINARVKNEGDFNEKFNVTAYYDDTPIATNASYWTDPMPFKSTTILTLTWDTAGVDLGAYRIKVVASTVPDEVDTMNNEFIDGTIAVTSFNKIDHPVQVKVDDVQVITFHVITESNSTVSNFQLVQADKKISFNVAGTDGTIGYCNVTIPKKLLRVNATHPWLVLLDGVNITDTTYIAENDTHTFIRFTYTLSTRKVEVIGAVVATPAPPKAIFAPSATSAHVGDTLNFDASASHDPDGTIVSYEWNFGDGTPIVTETNPTTTHMYTAAGKYTVTLTVTDDDDLTGTNRTDITISWIRDVAVINITVFPKIVKIGEPVYINVTIANEGNCPDPETFAVNAYYSDTIIRVWQRAHVGKIPARTEKTLNCTWDTTNVDAGTYVIKAVASTVPDEVDTMNNEFIDGTVTVATLPVASFTTSPTPPYYVGDTITFNASTSYDPDGTIVSYEWNFGDGTPIVTETNPTTTHMYTAAGNYIVTLTVTDSQGLTNTTTDTLTILEKHDVAVVNVTPSSRKVTVGELVSINVTVVNQGTETETFNVTVYYDNVTIGTKPVTNLAADTSETLTFNWETTNVEPRTYTIKAVASTVTDEVDTTNNEFIGGTVTIMAQEPPGLSILLYVAAVGAAAIIIVAMAFYFLRVKKQGVKNMLETKKSPSSQQKLKRKILKVGLP